MRRLLVAVLSAIAAVVLAFSPAVAASAAMTTPPSNWVDQYLLWTKRAGITRGLDAAWLRKVDEAFNKGFDPASIQNSVRSFPVARQLQAPGWWQWSDAAGKEIFISVKDFANDLVAPLEAKAAGSGYYLDILNGKRQLDAPYNLVTKGAGSKAAKAARVANGRTIGRTLTLLKEKVGVPKAQAYLRTLQSMGWIKGGAQVLGGASWLWAAQSGGSMIGNAIANAIPGLGDGATCSLDGDNQFLNGIKNYFADADCAAVANQIAEAARNADVAALQFSPNSITIPAVPSQGLAGGTVGVRSYQRYFGTHAAGICFDWSSAPQLGRIAVKFSSGVVVTGVFLNSATPVDCAAGNAYSGSTDDDPTVTVAGIAQQYTSGGALIRSSQLVFNTVKAADKNPSRTLQTCATVDGAEVCGPASDTFKEDDSSFPNAEGVPIPSGKVPSSVYHKVTDKSNGGSKQVDVTPTDPDVQQWAAQYPQCVDGSCSLDLKDLRSGVSCFDEKYVCANWQADPDKATHFRCDYAGDDLGLSACDVYKSSFEPTNVAQGNDITDPTTGDNLGTVTDPASSQTAAAACWSDGWGLAANPLDWVLTPVKCALVWAFVPDSWNWSQAVVDLEAAEGGRATPIAQLSQLWSDVSPNIHPSGCGGIDVGGHLGAVDFPQTKLMASCTGPLQPVRIAVSTIAAAMMVVATIVTCLRHIAAVVDYQSPLVNQMVTYSEGTL